MFQQVFSHYEVTAYKDEDGCPEQMYQFHTKRDAIARAELLAETFGFPYVEALAIYVNADDHTDLWGDKLVGVWRDGKRTA